MAALANSQTMTELNEEQVLRDELGHVLGDSAWSDAAVPLAARFKALHALPDEQRPRALCLSGGGIRSATFCLGVLQWLASQRQLEGFHYLSTVSGGGYIGSWLVNGIRQAGQPLRDAARASKDRPPARAAVHERRVEAVALRAGADWLHRVGQSAGCPGAAGNAGAVPAGGEKADPVAPLRALSNYLSPTGGLSGDAFSLAAIFVRNLLLNAVVWLAVLSALVALPRLYIAWLDSGSAAHAAGWIGWAVAMVSGLLVVFGVAYIVADLPSPSRPPPVRTWPSAARRSAQAKHTATAQDPRDWFAIACFIPVTLAAIALSLGGAWSSDLRAVSWWWFAAAGAAAHLLAIPVGILLRLQRGLDKRQASPEAVLVILAAGLLGGGLASVALTQLAGEAGQIGDGAEHQRLLYATFAVPAMTAAFWLAMALYAGLMSRFTDEQDREWWARATGYWLRFSLGWIFVFGLVVWLPLVVLDQLGSSGPTALQFGVGGGVLGVVTSLIGYWSKSGGEIRRKARGVLRLTRIRLLDALAAAVVVATLLALALAWNAVLDRCHGWGWTQRLCPAGVAAEADFLRQQSRMRQEHARQAAAARSDKAAAQVAAEADRAARWAEDATAAANGSAAARVYRHLLVHAGPSMTLWTTLGLVLVAGGLSLAMGVNHFSLHGMYGNRLVRAYLGSGRPRRRPHWFTGFDPQDNPRLEDFDAPLRGADGRPRLYPIVNIALNIVRPRPTHLNWQQRKAASFVATPRHCGAAGIGYRPSRGYGGGMSLGRALTISGAAASPNMGYHSSPLVTFVMTLFNVRLGWWSPNPGPAGERTWQRDQPRGGLKVALAEARGNTHDNDPYVYLSDGGHFDNLGIYEMVRRRCRLIVAVDATCDGDYRWLDLLETVRKVRIDFGIPIELPAVLPGSKSDKTARRWLEAPIRYSERDGNPRDSDGVLIVLKPRLLPETDPPELQAYAAISVPEGTPAESPARFPHQTTADQFFDEQQFESYRLLGFVTASDALVHSKAIAPSAARLGALPAAVAAQAVTAAAVKGVADDEEDEKKSRQAGMAELGAAGGLGGLMQQFGSGAALAAALTVGGTLGVAGTVALAPATLNLSETDRALLREGLAMRVDVGRVELDAGDRQLLRDGIQVHANASALEGPAGQLSRAAAALNEAVVNFSRWPSAASAPNVRVTANLDPALMTAIGDLRVAVASLRDRIRVVGSAGQTASAADDADLTSALVALRRTLIDIEKRLPSDPTLAKALTQLKDAVEGVAPRRNVRGQEGVGR